MMWKCCILNEYGRGGPTEQTGDAIGCGGGPMSGGTSTAGAHIGRRQRREKGRRGDGVRLIAGERRLRHGGQSDHSDLLVGVGAPPAGGRRAAGRPAPAQVRPLPQPRRHLVAQGP